MSTFTRVMPHDAIAVVWLCLAGRVTSMLLSALSWQICDNIAVAFVLSDM